LPISVLPVGVFLQSLPLSVRPFLYNFDPRSRQAPPSHFPLKGPPLLLPYRVVLCKNRRIFFVIRSCAHLFPLHTADPSLIDPYRDRTDRGSGTHSPAAGHRTLTSKESSEEALFALCFFCFFPPFWYGEHMMLL